MNIQSLNKQKKLVLISSVVGMIAAFLPWFKFEFFGITQTVNGMHGGGILVFICFAGAGILTLMGDPTKTIDKTFWTLVLLCGLVSTIMMVWLYIDADGAVRSFLSIGFYLTSLAAICILIFTLIFKGSGNTINNDV